MTIYPIHCSLSNAYLISKSGKYVLIDAGMPWDENLILNFLNQRISKLDLIYLTHAHPDHYGSCKAIQQKTSAPIAIHHKDEKLLRSGKILLGNTRGFGNLVKIIAWVFNLLPNTIIPDPNLLLDDGDQLTSIGIEAEVLHTPGHTPGSSSLLFPDGSVFVGDLASSTGSPHIQKYFAQDWSALSSSIKKVKTQKPMLLYPGHGRQPIEGKFLDGIVLDPSIN